MRVLPQTASKIGGITTATPLFKVQLRIAVKMILHFDLKNVGHRSRQGKSDNRRDYICDRKAAECLAKRQI